MNMSNAINIIYIGFSYFHFYQLPSQGISISALWAVSDNVSRIHEPRLGVVRSTSFFEIPSADRGRQPDA
jgi:hypothetical protein